LYKFNSLLSFLLFSMFTVEQLHFLSQYWGCPDSYNACQLFKESSWCWSFLVYTRWVCLGLPNQNPGRSLSAPIVTLLGLNIRLAQSLGMHCSPDPSTISDPAIIDEARVKFYIW
jgi:hypothetical protein